MPAFSLTVPHNLGKETARTKLASFVTRLKEKYADQSGDATGDWDGDVLKFSMTNMGMTISGTLEVLEDQVKIQGDLPFTAMMFKGKIVESFQQSIQKALAYQKP